MSTLKKIENERDYFFDPTSGVVYVRFWAETPQGGKQRVTRSTGVKAKTLPPNVFDMRMAISSGRKIIDGFSKEQKKSRRSGSRSLFIDYWFEKWIEEESPFWCKAYTSDIKSRWKCHLKKFFVDQEGIPEKEKRIYTIDQIDNNVWKKYVKWFWSRNPGKATDKHLKYLKSFLMWMHRQKNERTGRRLLVEVPDLEDFDAPRETPGRALSDSQVDEIIRSCETLAHSLQMSMMFDQGMRPKEVTTCLLSYIKMDRPPRGEIEIPASMHKSGKKTRRARTIPLSPRTSDILERYLIERAEALIKPWGLNALYGGEIPKSKKPFKIALDVKSDALFPSPINPIETLSPGGNRRAFARIKKLAQIEGRLRRHDGRVTTATRFAEAGVPRAIAKEVLTMTDEVLDRHYVKVRAESRSRVYEHVENARKSQKKSQRGTER